MLSTGEWIGVYSKLILVFHLPWSLHGTVMIIPNDWSSGRHCLMWLLLGDKVSFHSPHPKILKRNEGWHKKCETQTKTYMQLIPTKNLVPCAWQPFSQHGQKWNQKVIFTQPNSHWLIADSTSLDGGIKGNHKSEEYSWQTQRNTNDKASLIQLWAKGRHLVQCNNLLSVSKLITLKFIILFKNLDCQLIWSGWPNRRCFALLHFLHWSKQEIGHFSGFTVLSPSVLYSIQ